jgi:hypothetical protein
LRQENLATLIQTFFPVAGAPSSPKTFFSRPEVQQEVESKVSPFDKFRNLDQQATQQNTSYAPG